MPTEIVLSLAGLVSGVLLFFVGFAFGRSCERRWHHARIMRRAEADLDAAERRVNERIACGARETDGRIV